MSCRSERSEHMLPVMCAVLRLACFGLGLGSGLAARVGVGARGRVGARVGAGARGFELVRVACAARSLRPRWSTGTMSASEGGSMQCSNWQCARASSAPGVALPGSASALRRVGLRVKGGVFGLGWVPTER